MNSINLLVLVLTICLCPIYVKSDCITDAECVGIEGGVCINNNCMCPVGQIFNPANIKCIEVSPYIMSPCTENIQCQRLFAGYRCDNETNTCLCNDGFRYLEGRCWPIAEYGEPCVTKNQCYNRLLPHSLDCNDNICGCAEGYYRKQTNNCRKIVNTINGACVLDSDCQIPGVANAVCRSMRCVDAGTNILSYPVEHINFFADISNEISNVTVRALEGEACMADGDCSSLENAECSPQRHCICKRGYYPNPERNLCLAELGQRVSRNNQCTGLMATVEDNVCDCPNGFFYDEKSFLRECIKPTRTFNEACADDDSCFTFGMAGRCVQLDNSFFKVCDCDATMSIKNETLQMCTLLERDVGESCIPTDLCPPGSECTDGKCQCVDGAIVLPGNKACIFYNLALGDQCVLDEQCQTSNSACKDGVCSCQDVYYPDGNNCKTGLGGNCESILCEVAHSQCIEFNDTKQCRCRSDYIPQGIDTCLKKSTSVNEECVSSLQCWDNLGGEEAVSCESGRCVCRENHHDLIDGCWRTSGLDESCSRSQNCYLPNGPSDTVECRNKICQCKWDYVRLYSPDSCSGAERLLSKHMVILVLMSILYLIYS